MNRRSIRGFLVFLLTVLMTNVMFAPFSQPSKSNSLVEGAVEAVKWGLQFYITPTDFRYGIPSHNEKAWGFGQYYYDNGTGTPGGGTWMDEYVLVGGHDSGQYGLASLKAYETTNDTFFLDYFEKVFFSHYNNVQAPNPSRGIPEYIKIDGWDCSLSGYFVEQASYKPGPDKEYGTKDDEVIMDPSWPSAEHGNPIAFALIEYYKLTKNVDALKLVEEYANWVIEQIYDKSTSFPGAVGAIPVEALANTSPRMFETSQSAWLLTELYFLTNNQTYLEAAERIGNFMLETQWSKNWNKISATLPPPQDERILGGLPYLWYETLNSTLSYSTLTIHAGFVLMAWARLYEATGNTIYLYGIDGSPSRVEGGALAYANWLLSMQVTPEGFEWGDSKYSGDPYAVGGFYSGFDVGNPWNPRANRLDVFQPVWASSYGIPGLLKLYEITKDPRYLKAAELAGNWLLGLRRDIKGNVKLFTIAGNYTYKDGGFWGLYPQRYMPDDSAIEPIKLFREKGLLNLDSITKKKLSWYEERFGVNLSLEIWREANRGEKYMKEISFFAPLERPYIGTLAWQIIASRFDFPRVGFEPRYESEVALGLFDIGAAVNPQPSENWTLVEIAIAVVAVAVISGAIFYRKRMKGTKRDSQ